MRVIFNEELKQVADDLDRMAQNVRKAIKGAGEALLNQDVEAAQTVIDGDIEIDALESSVIDQCVKLLAKQNPVATDLRVVVSTMRLASTFERMGDLARHVAEAARRTYPAAAIPESAQPVFAEMIDFLDNTADQLVAMLFDRDAKTAEAIRRQVGVDRVVAEVLPQDKEREIRRNQKVVSIKEVQLSATIEENDIQTKAKAAVKFLQGGDKVKVSIRFRGRQITHQEIGLAVMQDFVTRVKDVAIVERKPLVEGRHMIMILAPKDPSKEAKQAPKE